MEVADLWIRLRSINGEFNKSMANSAKEGENFATRTTNAMAAVGKATTLAAAGITVASIKMAGDFQQQTNVLITAAGEHQKNIGKVRDGLMNISRETGTSLHQLTDGMYEAEKAGRHFAEGGLNVVRAAAQGALEEGAPLNDVVSAMTAIMNNLALPASWQNSVKVMNALKTAAGEAKATFQQFSTAIPTALPSAFASKVKLPDVLGSVATMTQRGETALHAAQLYRGALVALLAPSQKATSMLNQLGLTTQGVNKSMAKNGMAGTMNMIAEAIGKTAKGGGYALNIFKQSAQAAASADAMIKGMSPPLAKNADAFKNNKMSVSDFRKTLKEMSLDDNAKGTQFLTLMKRSRGFNDQLKSGNGPITTFAALLKGATGGISGMQTALLLTGQNAGDAKKNIAAIGKSFNDSSKDVEGFKNTQLLFNVQMARLERYVQAAAVTYGMKLLPVLKSTFDWFGRHQTVMKVVGGILAGFLTLSVLAFAAKAVAAIGKPVVSLAKMGVAGIKAGANIVRGFKSAETAASSMSGKAGTLGGKLRTMWNAGVSGAKKAGGALAKAGRAAASGAAAAGRGAARVAKLGASYVAAGAKATGSALASAGRKAASAAAAAGRGALAVGRLGVAYAVTGVKAAASAAKTVAFKVVQLAIAGASKAWAAAQWLLNAALDANPIGLIVIAIAALVAGFILAYNKVGWFRDAVNACMKGIGIAVGWVVNFVKSHWKLLVAIFLGPIGIVIALIAAFGPKIKGYIARAVAAVMDKLHALSRLGDQAAAWFRGIYDAAVRWFHRVLDWCQKLPHLIYLKLIALGKLMSEVGHNLINGLIRGIEDGAGWLWSKIKSLGSQAWNTFKSAFDINSPSRMTQKIGHSVGEGLALGIDQSTKQSVAAAKRHAAAVKKQMETLHKQLVSFFKKENLAAGLEGAVDKIKETIKKLNTEVLYAWRRGGISTSKASHLLTLIRDDNTKLQGLAKARQKILDTIAAAKAFRADTKSGAIGFANITGLGETSSSTDMAGKLRDKLLALKDFAKNIAKLAKTGLNKTSLRQLIEAGPEAAAQMAGELANGPAAILKSINDTQSQINAVAGQLGTTGADALYGKTSALQSQANAITKLMKHAADQLVKALEHALGVKHKGKTHLARDSSGHAHLARAVAAKHKAQAKAARAHRDAPDRPIHLEVKVHLDGKEIYANTQKHALRTAKRNPTNGLQPR